MPVANMASNSTGGSLQTRANALEHYSSCATVECASQGTRAALGYRILKCCVLSVEYLSVCQIKNI